MTYIPAILVATDRGHFRAYRTEDSRTRLAFSTEFDEGKEKLSDLVTDQAGAFPNPGSASSSSAERLPLEAELEARCIRQIADAVDEVLSEHETGGWALCAPSEIHQRIVDQLSLPARERLSVQVRKNLVNSPPADLVRACEEAARQEARVV